jgi:DNA-binding ferritin-like protein
MAQLTHLAEWLRMGQFVNQDYHQRVNGPTFRSDHAMFGEFYDALGHEYDGLIEHLIGLGVTVRPSQVTAHAADLAVDFAKKTDPREMASAVFMYERSLITIITDILDSDTSEDLEIEVTEALENRLQTMAQASDGRSYILRQRIA